MKAVSLGVWSIAVLSVVLLTFVLAARFVGVLNDFELLSITLALVYGVAALGLVVLTGYAGQISLGHGAFFALGAYTCAILASKLEWQFPATIPVVVTVCFAFGYAFGLPALRLKGHHLALATFCLAVAVPQILKYRHLEWYTGGVQGLLLPSFGMPYLGTDYQLQTFLFVAMVALPVFVGAYNLLSGWYGRVLCAVRDHETAAISMGIDATALKAHAFGLSAALTGLAGALHATIFEFVSPDAFGFELSILLLIGAIVGGIRSLLGAAIGGVFIQVVDKYADAGARSLSASLKLPVTLEPWTIYGVTLIILMFLLPSGFGPSIIGLIERLWARFRRRRTATSYFR